MQEKNEGEIFKGLFFGFLLGIGLVWFLSTEEGQKIKKQVRKKGNKFLDQARESIDAALKEEIPEDPEA